MNLQEIATEMLKDIEKYAMVQEVEVPKIVQAKKHNKKRINKKWLKHYGTTIVYEKKMAKVADITLENVIEFCAERGLPLPDEFLIEGEYKHD